MQETMHSLGSQAKEHTASSEQWMLSLVVPVMNEEDNIAPFLEAVFSALEHKVPALEVLFVDDGSKDTTLERLKAAADRDKRIRYLSFSRNFGKEVLSFYL